MSARHSCARRAPALCGGLHRLLRLSQHTCAFGCLALAITLPAAAQEQAEPAPPTTITVRGAPPPRSASEAVVDKRVLQAAPHRNASELLLTVPGVFVSQHGGEGKAHQIFFRGFDAVHGQDVELWAAGAPVNDVSNIHGQGYADLHFLIPDAAWVTARPRRSHASFRMKQAYVFATAGAFSPRWPFIALS